MPEGDGAREYYYGSSSPRRPRRDDRHPRLPSIHEVLEDVLARPAWPTHPVYEHQLLSRSLPPMSFPGPHGPSSGAGYSLPPLRHHDNIPPSSFPTPQMSYSVPERTHIPLPAASQLQEHPGRQVNAQTPSHSYGLYRSSSTGELVHQETSSRDYFPRRPVKSDPGASSRRHICEDCGERFDRPNTLDTHKRTHTKEKPFQCSFPGCNKRFSVKSNMRRHERIHGARSAYVSVDVPSDDASRLGPSKGSSSHYTRGKSSSTSPQPSSSSPHIPAHYYYSSYPGNRRCWLRSICQTFISRQRVK